jgi:hypothetical protein
MSQRIITADEHHRLTLAEQDGTTIIHKATDVAPVLHRAEQLRQAGATKTRDGDHLAAVIPIALLQEWAQKRGMEWQMVAQDDHLLGQFLNDPDYKKCRVYEGRV